MLVLAEPLQPPAFAEAMTHACAPPSAPRYEDVSFSAVADALRHLRAGKCLAITCDRDIQGNGEPVEFFGVETRVPLGAVELAARTGAALIPCYCRRAADGGFDIIFEEAAAAGEHRHHAKQTRWSTPAASSHRAEAWIRADPGQWMLLERIWGTSVPANSPRTPPASTK